VSETDTEVIVKLCKYIYDNSDSKPTFPEVSGPPAPPLPCLQSFAPNLHSREYAAIFRQCLSCVHIQNAGLLWEAENQKSPEHVGAGDWGYRV